MDESVKIMEKAAVLSALDDKSGYWKLDVDKRDHDKTVFASDHGT